MHSKKIVLDFDGTIFRLFTNYNLDSTISEISECMKSFDIDFPLSCDVFDSFYYVANANLDLSKQKELFIKINDIIVNAEIEALSSGILTDGFFAFLEYAKKENISIGIASNNSKECITEFFKKFCNDLKLPIVGRNPTRPDLMKPHPMMLNQICNIFSCSNSDIVFVGDNIRDYQCALSFGAKFVALAPTTKKYERLIKNGLNIKEINVVRDFFELIELIKEKINF